MSLQKVLIQSAPTYNTPNRPAFIYFLKSSDGKISFNFIIETKDIESRANLRGTEQPNIHTAQKIFESISDKNIAVRFAPQLKRGDIVNQIKQVVT